MRAIAVALLLVCGPAFADGDLAVDKKITSLTTKDKKLTKVDVLFRVPSTLACFSKVRTVDVTLTVKDGAPTAKTNAGDAATNDCLVKAFSEMKVTGTFTAKVRLVSKPDPRKLDALTKALSSSSEVGLLQMGSASGPGTGVAPASNAQVSSTPAPDGSLGTYTMEDINTVVVAHAGAIRACYQKELESEPKLAGKFTYHVEIGETGAVASAKLKSSTVKSPRLDACITHQLQAFKFPAKGKASFNYPFVFQAQ